VLGRRAARPGRDGDRPGGPLVFITGASSGIGQALAAALPRGRLAAGAGGAARRRAAQAWAQAQGWRASAAAVYAADVRDVDSITAAGQRLHRRAGPARRGDRQCRHQRRHGHAERADLDVMRATPGHQQPRPGRHLPPFVARCASAAAARLVGIASVAGIRGLPGHGAYCASKAAVIATAKACAASAGHGVKVVTICRATSTRR
jgi:NADP-dependent 3-hydroxy acid dehydrogenase YdfG